MVAQVVVLYVGEDARASQRSGCSNRSGFLTTFSLLVRERMPLSDLSWMLVNGGPSRRPDSRILPLTWFPRPVFFGSVSALDSNIGSEMQFH